MTSTFLTASERREAVLYMAIERDLLISLSFHLSNCLDEMTRKASVEAWIQALRPEQAQIAAEMLWRIFPYDEENLSKWQQSKP